MKQKEPKPVNELCQTCRESCKQVVWVNVRCPLYRPGRGIAKPKTRGSGRKGGAKGRKASTLCAIICVLTALWGVSRPAVASAGDTPLKIDLNAIKEIESSGNPLAVSPAGAIGLYQIMPGSCLADYNQYHEVTYTRAQLFLPWVNERIADWYLHTRIPQLLRHYGQDVTEENILISYNAGISRVIKGETPPATERYIEKYRQLTGGEK